MYLVSACYNGECWMSAKVSSLADALVAAAKWLQIDNVNAVEVKEVGRAT